MNETKREKYLKALRKQESSDERVPANFFNNKYPSIQFENFGKYSNQTYPAKTLDNAQRTISNLIDSVVGTVDINTITNPSYIEIISAGRVGGKLNSEMWAMGKRFQMFTQYTEDSRFNQHMNEWFNKHFGAGKTMTINNLMRELRKLEQKLKQTAVDGHTPYALNVVKYTGRL